MIYKYGTATTIVFPLVKAGTTNLATSSDYTYAAGDIKISKDGGAAANPTNSPTAVTMGNGAIWTLALTATEMEAKVIAVTIVDSATKAVEDQIIILETYGEAVGSINTQDFADGLLRRNLASVSESGLPSRSPLNAIRFLRNRWAVATGTLTVYKEDDSTSAWTSTLSTTASADAIIGSDPA
jgi:hypothetical protein